MRKYYFLIIVALILGLVLTGCSLLSNVGQVPTSEQSGISYLSKGVPPDLVGLWHLDEGTGITANDSSGNDNDGTIKGATYAGSANAMFGNALSFDGTNDYVEIANDPSLNITQGTWEAWIKFDVLPSVAGHPMNPLAKANQYWIHGSRNDPDSGTTDAIVVKIRVGGTRYCAKTSSSFITAGTWYHVAGTYDGETLKLYVNGTLVDSNTTPSGNIDTGTQIMAVGTWSTLIDYFQGIIDEVRIWNTALTDDQLILYDDFNGLLAPYKEPPKAFKAGSSIPLKWQYTDLFGTAVDSSAANPSVEIKWAANGNTFVEGEPIEVLDPGSSGYQYDSETDTWQFNWQTKNCVAGTYNIWIINNWTGQTFGSFEIQLR